MGAPHCRAFRGCPSENERDRITQALHGDKFARSLGEKNRRPSLGEGTSFRGAQGNFPGSCYGPDPEATPGDMRRRKAQRVSDELLAESRPTFHHSTLALPGPPNPVENPLFAPRATPNKISPLISWRGLAGRVMPRFPFCRRGHNHGRRSTKSHGSRSLAQVAET